MNMIKGLLHAKITIPNGAVKEAKQFYCDVLGLEEISRPISSSERGGFWLRVGNDQIHVSEGNEPGTNVNRGYFAYEVANVDELQTRLKAYQIELSPCERCGDYESFCCYDPFGNQLEFMMSIHDYHLVH